MKYIDVFKMPKTVKITARTSSITNSFVNGIIPCILPTEEEIKHVLNLLGMDKDRVTCAYCGDKCTEWDHFRPLVRDKRPTGYISEINNLIPSCGKCNQSKGNKHWKDWMLSDAHLSPKTRNVPNLDSLIEKLENFERQTTPIKIDFESIVGQELWQTHWENCTKLHSQMRSCQIVSEKIRERISASLNKQKSTISKQPNQMQQPKPNHNLYNNLSALTSTEKKVGIIVQTDFKNLLESNILSDWDIQKLQEIEYCKNIFDMNFAVLLKVQDGISISKQRKDHFGRDRYYSTPVTIKGERYLLSSQWYDRSKQKLIAFIMKHRA